MVVERLTLLSQLWSEVIIFLDQNVLINLALMPHCITSHCQLQLDERSLDLLGDGHPEPGLDPSLGLESLDAPDLGWTAHLGSSPRRPWILGGGKALAYPIWRPPAW